MRLCAILILIPSAACTAPLQSRMSEPVVHVNYGDLALTTAAGRAGLRLRVGAAAEDYCRDYSRDVLPTVSRAHRYRCLSQVRYLLTAEMPPLVRRAYARALREDSWRSNAATPASGPEPD
jgi:UrcA family protein